VLYRYFTSHWNILTVQRQHLSKVRLRYYTITNEFCWCFPELCIKTEVCHYPGGDAVRGGSELALEEEECATLLILPTAGCHTHTHTHKNTHTPATMIDAALTLTLVHSSMRPVYDGSNRGAHTYTYTHTHTHTHIPRANSVVCHRNLKTFWS